MKIAFLLLQLGGVASQRRISGIASPGNTIHFERDVDLSSDRTTIKISSVVPVTVQRYENGGSFLEGQQPVPGNFAKVLVTSDCDTGETGVVPNVVISDDGSVAVGLDVTQDEADAMPFLEPSSYSALWTWVSDYCGDFATTALSAAPKAEGAATIVPRALQTLFDGKPCQLGSFADPAMTCALGEFCQLDMSVCNDVSGIHNGTCTAIPQFCTQEYNPVCGCDGEDYSNACSAHAQGVSVSGMGLCPKTTTTTAETTEPSVANNGLVTVVSLPSCIAGLTCFELGSKCTRGTETCCGQTFDSFECTCQDTGNGVFAYSGCFFTDACLIPACCRDRPIAASPPPAIGTCTSVGDLCDKTGVEQDYCCIDPQDPMATFCTKTGGRVSSPSTTSPTSSPTTTLVPTSPAPVFHNSSPIPSPSTTSIEPSTLAPTSAAPSAVNASSNASPSPTFFTATTLAPASLAPAVVNTSSTASPSPIFVTKTTLAPATATPAVVIASSNGSVSPTSKTESPSATPTTSFPTSTPSTATPTALPTDTSTSPPTTVTPSATTTTDTPTTNPTVFSTISVLFNATFPISVQNGTHIVSRRQLRRLVSDIFTDVVKNSIQSVLQSTLTDGQTIEDIIITGISQSGEILLIDCQVILEERCIGSCEEQLENTTIYTTATNGLKEAVANGNFTATLRELAANESEGCDECLKTKNATLAATNVATSNPIVMVTTDTPTAAPTATTTPSSLAPTSATPMVVNASYTASSSPTSITTSSGPTSFSSKSTTTAPVSSSNMIIGTCNSDEECIAVVRSRYPAQSSMGVELCQCYSASSIAAFDECEGENDSCVIAKCTNTCDGFEAYCGAASSDYGVGECTLRPLSMSVNSTVASSIETSSTVDSIGGYSIGGDVITSAPSSKPSVALLPEGASESMNSAFGTRSFSLRFATTFMAIVVISFILQGNGEGGHPLRGLGKCAVVAMAVSSLYSRSSPSSKGGNIRKSNQGPRPFPSRTNARNLQTCSFNVEILIDGCAKSVKIDAPASRVINVVITNQISTLTFDDGCRSTTDLSATIAFLASREENNDDPITFVGGGC
ncbi:hypothetical protein ACHAW5_000650 [Stephanodiscus triporus]|uniref:Kazal-like domain-containing protein n=1 Tax=Stephanodiscus triporus TaxID=2934178 RepID=A0ABD3MZ75_9STRA